MTPQEWKDTPSVTLTDDLVADINHPPITLTSFEDKNELLTDEGLRENVGYGRMEDGTWQVSCYCPMPGVTAAMINWWFWWHPKADVRYQAWYPEMHRRIRYRASDDAYFQKKQLPRFQDNVQYPTETIGNSTLECVLKFVSPEEDGFDPTLMRQVGVPVIVCAHVGMLKGLVMHTEMAHICFQRVDGLLMVSRFWMGELIPRKGLRERMITEQRARGMCEHCLVEYRNMAKRLPDLYEQYGPHADGTCG